MKKILAAFALALSLMGCASELQTFKTVYSIVTETTVSPQAILVAANSFDAIQGTATQYLVYCKSNLTVAKCSADNRRSVIKYVRAGRAARNQLETYLTQQTPAPSQIYNVMVAAINSLEASPVGAAK